MRRTLIPVGCLLVMVIGCGKQETDITPLPEEPELPPLVTWKELPPLPNPLGFGGPFAGVSNGALVVAGGAHFPVSLFEGGTKLWKDTVFVLEPGKDEWLSGLKLPRPLAYGASITTSDGLILAGGCDSKEHFADVYRLNWANGKIETKPLASLPKPCAYTSAARVGSIIYMAGGQESPNATSAMKNFWALDTSKPDGRWQVLEPWPGPARILPVAAACDGKFYVFTGCDLHAGEDGKAERTYLRDAYRYDPTGKTWEKLAEMPRPAVAAPTPAMVLGTSRILLCSGDDGKLVGKIVELKAKHPGFHRDTLAFNTEANAWATVGDVPLGQVTNCTATWQDMYVVPSGEVRPGVRTPKVYAAAPVD